MKYVLRHHLEKNAKWVELEDEGTLDILRGGDVEDDVDGINMIKFCNTMAYTGISGFMMTG
jgi:hypothetical protein